MTILEMTAPTQPTLIATDPTANARRILAMLAEDGYYIEVTSRAFVRCIHKPIYRYLIPVVDVSWLLVKCHIEADTGGLFWITDSGRQAAGGE